MRTDTFDEIDRLFDRMHRFAGIDEGDGWGDHVLSWNDHGGLRVDLSEDDDDLIVVADLPGFDREEIDLSVADERLVIAASHDEMDEETDGEKDGNYLRRERRASTVRRSIDLPVAVDADGAEASYTNGVLTVTLPKQAESEGHRIDVD
ncbi:MAG: Hsp20/alpha crystallin family protein [Halolamina sp.]